MSKQEDQTYAKPSKRISREGSREALIDALSDRLHALGGDVDRLRDDLDFGRRPPYGPGLISIALMHYEAEHRAATSEAALDLHICA